MFDCLFFVRFSYSTFTQPTLSEALQILYEHHCSVLHMLSRCRMDPSSRVCALLLHRHPYRSSVYALCVKLARDLMEDGRCARSHEIAKSFGIKISDTDPFWKDRTFLELNYAVSFTELPPVKCMRRVYITVVRRSLICVNGGI